MVFRAVLCVLAVLVVCGANRDRRGPPRRRNFRPEHRHGDNPLQRFIRKSTRDSLELDILVTAGVDPCKMNDSKVVLKAGGSYESQVIGHLSESLIFGLRGFDDFRQKIVGHHVATRLAFHILEGSSKVTLIGKNPFQTNFIMSDVIVDIYSKLNLKDNQVSLSNSKLIRSKPRVLLQPSEPVFPHFLKPIATSFLKSAQNCIKKNFIPTFQSGINHALSTKNISKLIEKLQSQPAIIHQHYSNAINGAASKVMKMMKELKLPFINVNLENDKIQYNFTQGRIIEISPPKLYFVNQDNQKDTYNLQIVIKDITILYKLQNQPVSRIYSNIKYFLQVKESKTHKLQILAGKVFRFDLQPRPMPLPYPVMKEFNNRLMSIFVKILQNHLRIVFSTAL